MVQTCKRCLMSTDISSVIIGKDGICNFCKIHDSLEEESKKFDFFTFVVKLRYANKGRKYDCLIGVSGGIDSSFLLEYTVKTLRLRPLVIHFQNWWNVPEADANIQTMVQALNVDFIQYSMNTKEYDEICKSFLLASVSDADIPNDMAMAYYMMKTADEYGIKWIFNGHDFRREGTSPLCWTYMDAKYIESVHKKVSGKGISSFPLLTFRDQLWYALKGIRHIRPLYYINYNPQVEKIRLAKEYGWRDYGVKHSENNYTWFIGAMLLPMKFDIDKRKLYLSAQMRSGIKERGEALIEMNNPLLRTKDYDTLDLIKVRLGISQEEWKGIMEAPRHFFGEYYTYRSHFKRWKWAIWLLTKIRVFPKLFYVKYCN